MIFKIILILISISLIASIIGFAYFAINLLKIKNDTNTSNFVKTNAKVNVLFFGITTVIWGCVLSSLLVYQDSIRDFVINNF
ncbi:hypothetical protein [Bacillus bombysepticus]|uniref:hypothetical protein n=1 Tax=Bacillus bombysepticus TaxID=658666 RepID=UPI0030158E0B